MVVTVRPIAIRTLGTVTKRMVKGVEELEIRGQIETIQTSILLRWARIRRRVVEICGDLLSLQLSKKPSANFVVKNSQGINNNNYYNNNNYQPDD